MSLDLTYARHPSLYFEDGDIVLSTNVTDTLRLLFRVHRVILCFHSQVFRDMFAVGSQQSGDSESYDGLPLVSLQGDNFRDLESLFEIMYDPTALYKKLCSKRRADIPQNVSGLLGIAEKYIVSNVSERISDHIASEWPQTLDEWRIRALELENIARSSEVSLPEPASAIWFAYKHDVPEILPAAFLHLSIIPARNEWIDSPPPENELPRELVPGTTSFSARWSLLDGRTAIQLMRGKEKIRQFFVFELHKALVPTEYPVQDSSGRMLTLKCACGPDLFDDVKREHVPFDDVYLDVFAALQTIRNDRWHPCTKLCSDCRLRVSNTVDELERDIWNKLPEFFGLPEWE